MSSAVAGQVRNRYILLADLLLISVAALGAYTLRFDWLFLGYRSEFPWFLGAVLLVKVPVFHAFGLYRRYWRYASVRDLLVIALASSAAIVLLGVVMGGLRLSELVDGFPRSVLPIDWLLTMALVGGVRMSVRVLAEMQQGLEAPTAETKRVLIAGAGYAGVLVARELQRNPQIGKQAIGFLDDDETKVGKTILGLPVFARLDDLGRVLKAARVDEVVIALPTAPGTVVRSVVDRARVGGVPSKVIPGVYELLDGKLNVNRLRNVEISDLLRRSPVQVDKRPRLYVSGRTVLVTGAGGSIGSELCRQVARDNPARLVLLGHGENSIFEAEGQLRAAFPALSIKCVIADVRDRARLSRIFEELRPAVVFHAAAHKHVPLMEANAEEAITNNVVGTRNIVTCALAAGVDRLVMISTDKAVAPMNIMGASKRLAEMIVRDAARRHSRRFAVVRFGNVLGSRGSVVPIFKAQIEHGGPLTVTHPDMRRYFMTIPEAVHLVLEAGGEASGGELFVLNMGKPVRIVDLAEDLMELSGLKRGDIEIKFTGLRPGEKLDEELWEEGASVDPILTGDVLSVREPDDFSGPELVTLIDQLERAARDGDRLEIQHCLLRLIPSFAPAVTSH